MIVDLQWCLWVAQRVDDSMRIISNEVEDCFDECESTYKEMLDEFNKTQKSDQEQIHYERLEFDYKEKNVCQLCLHASKSDRKMGSLLGRSYHPECANLWFSRIDKMIPVFVSKEDSLFM